MTIPKDKKRQQFKIVYYGSVIVQCATVQYTVKEQTVQFNFYFYSQQSCLMTHDSQSRSNCLCRVWKSGLSVCTVVWRSKTVRFISQIQEKVHEDEGNPVIELSNAHYEGSITDLYHPHVPHRGEYEAPRSQPASNLFFQMLKNVK